MKDRCVHCGTAKGLLEGEPVECSTCYDFFAEMNWYDYEDKAQRIDAFLEARRQEIEGEGNDE